MRPVDLRCTEIWTRATLPSGVCAGATAVCAVFINAQLICGTNRAHLTAERSGVARVARVVVESEVAVRPVACLAVRQASEYTNDDEQIHIYNENGRDAMYSKTLGYS